MTLPSTVRQGNSTGVWNTTPMSRRGPLIGVPFKSTSPSVCGSRPANTLSRVDLPQPDGPTTAMNSPSAIENEISLSARTPVAPRPYLSDRRRTEMTEPGDGGFVMSTWTFKPVSGINGAELWRWQGGVCHKVSCSPDAVYT